MESLPAIPAPAARPDGAPPHRRVERRTARANVRGGGRTAGVGAVR